MNNNYYIIKLYKQYEQLSKFFELGIADVFVHAQVNEEEKEIRKSVNINQEQLDDFYISIHFLTSTEFFLLSQNSKIWD